MFFKGLFLTLFSSSFVLAESVLTPHFITEQEYISGEQVCAKFQEQIRNEKSLRVNVPVDYQNPQAGEVSLYAFFEKDFDSKLPTLVFVTGGPGQNSHDAIHLSHLGINVLTFDQRGIACSRPAQYQLYKDPKFYSSENTAKDLERIRQSLKIEKWAVMGVSYGTIPATIYANMFPEHTQSLILEGVVFSAGDELWEAPHRRKVLQRFLNKQSADFRKFISDMIDVEKLPDYWFSMVARNFLMNNHGLERIESFINQMRESNSIKQSVIELFKATRLAPDELADQDLTVMAMIGCQELGMASESATPYDRWTGQKLEPSTYRTKVDYCDAFGIGPKKLYQATDYPLHIPVTYFEGALDGATQAPFAVQHYKNVAKGSAQLMIMPNGGHNANLMTLYQVFIDPANRQYPLEETIFMSALRGEKIEALMVQNFNKVGPDRWAFVQKKWAKPAPVSPEE